ncbi:hypothetical protein BT63DRAFT_451865 [Microthyrium microscopicum]|uniref:Uncharacterized protein n=1 Tax=Microthyrium microscopicum TaxID=703497 RepID=A0A6A6UPV2_9PEZI|nr:hypothetical protein BT63DRAFT_451865 [Microthyrium microscopicum]
MANQPPYKREPWMTDDYLRFGTPEDDRVNLLQEWEPTNHLVSSGVSGSRACTPEEDRVSLLEESEMPTAGSRACTPKEDGVSLMDSESTTHAEYDSPPCTPPGQVIEPYSPSQETDPSPSPTVSTNSTPAASPKYYIHIRQPGRPAPSTYPPPNTTSSPGPPSPSPTQAEPTQTLTPSHKDPRDKCPDPRHHNTAFRRWVKNRRGFSEADVKEAFALYDFNLPRFEQTSQVINRLEVLFRLTAVPWQSSAQRKMGVGAKLYHTLNQLMEKGGWFQYARLEDEETGQGRKLVYGPWIVRGSPRWKGGELVKDLPEWFPLKHMVLDGEAKFAKRVCEMVGDERRE